MCGIYFSLHEGETDAFAPSLGHKELIKSRGPDIQSNVHLALVSPNLFATVYCSVLSLRGTSSITQPLTSSRGGLLCFNGEAWEIDGERVVGNDTEAVFKILEEAAERERYMDYEWDCCMDHSPIMNALTTISGPFAFVYFDRPTQRLWFGRDRLGRRSLLIGAKAGAFAISSVTDASDADWEEMSAGNIGFIDCKLRDYALENLDSARNDGHKTLTCPEWFMVQKERLQNEDWSTIVEVPKLNRTTQTPPSCLKSVVRLEDLLSASMRLRMVLPESTINRQVLGPSRIQTSSADHGQVADTVFSPDPPCLNPPARLAVLFSGGLDCTVLARMAHDMIEAQEPIDLLTVAFENPHVHNLVKLRADGISPYDICPDRITAHASHEELKRVCSTTRFRLVEINVPYQEVERHRSQVVRLMSPHDTEMDLSISLALYFAARGAGVTADIVTGERVPCKTKAKVLLSGLGADELFAGYQRHATAFKNNGASGLLKELEIDYERLGARNLGRDDRVISHWGKEARYPYLDEKLVKWAVESPYSDKCGFGLPDDEIKDDLSPDKLVLRLLARKLGMHGAAREKKRAIQFGARTAKMDGKTTGTASIKRVRSDT